jgi:hypothetical protein
MIPSKKIEAWLEKAMNKYVVPHSKVLKVEAFNDKYNSKGAGIILHFGNNHSYVLRITDLKTGR